MNQILDIAREIAQDMLKVGTMDEIAIDELGALRSPSNFYHEATGTRPDE